MKRLGIAAVLLAALAVGSPAMAAQSATLVLRSGERIGGELVDMGAGGLTFRVNGQTRQVPIDQVAVIDFVGGGTNFSSAELDQVGDGGVVTTSGESVKGRLYDVVGQVPAEDHDRPSRRRHARLQLDRPEADLRRRGRPGRPRRLRPCPDDRPPERPRFACRGTSGGSTRG